MHRNTKGNSETSTRYFIGIYDSLKCNTNLHGALVAFCFNLTEWLVQKEIFHVTFRNAFTLWNAKSARKCAYRVLFPFGFRELVDRGRTESRQVSPPSCVFFLFFFILSHNRFPISLLFPFPYVIPLALTPQHLEQRQILFLLFSCHFQNFVLRDELCFHISLAWSSMTIHKLVCQVSVSICMVSIHEYSKWIMSIKSLHEAVLTRISWFLLSNPILLQSKVVMPKIAFNFKFGILFLMTQKLSILSHIIQFM